MIYVLLASLSSPGLSTCPLTVVDSTHMITPKGDGAGASTQSAASHAGDLVSNPSASLNGIPSMRGKEITSCKSHIS